MFVDLPITVIHGSSGGAAYVANQTLDFHFSSITLQFSHCENFARIKFIQLKF